VQYEYPEFVLIVDEDQRYIETRFPDGTSIGATPNEDDRSLRTAADLGYGSDTWAMSRDHELAHAWLAHLDGMRWSPTMWRLAHPYGDDLPDDAQVAEEEARVLAFQRALDKVAPRPWDAGPVPHRRDGTPWSPR
jgi:hypothetical protein